MALGAQPVSAKPGISAALIVAVLILGSLLAVVLRAEAGRGLGPGDWQAVRFTVVQAALSAGFSLAGSVASPVAN